MALFRQCVILIDTSCTRQFTHLAKYGNQVRKFETSATRSSRWPHKNKKSSFAEVPVKDLPSIENRPVSLSTLVKPFIFTVAFSSASIAGCAIWQYETMRAKAVGIIRRQITFVQEQFKQKKTIKWREEMNTWWNSLTEGQRLFVPICFMNAVVFLAWRVPRLQPSMMKYFCSNPASSVLCWPMVLSTFSHYSLFHIAANMYVLHSFSSGAVAALGKEQFLALYLSAGVMSSFTSFLYKVIMKQPGLSIGASGAIMGVLGYVCTQFPDTKLAIILLPMYTFTAGTAIKFIMGLDLAGVLMGWKFFDHAAHLGGALFGISWCYWGNKYIWQRREPLLEWWHKLRSGEK